jgi:hypothetical protein
MYINRDQILFYENMMASGKVAQAIVAYKASGSTATGTQQAPATSGSQLQNPAGTGQGAGAQVPAGPAAGSQVGQ